MQVNRAQRLLGAALALVSIAGLAGFALHIRLVKSFPTEDQVVHQAPADIQLWFSQVPELSLTKVRLLGPEDVTVTVAKAVATDDVKSVKLAIVDSLPEGTYSVTWQTASPDGHKVRGEYAFTYSPTPTDEPGEPDGR
ncbi:MAG: copper resistance CopC family protein [Gemmatimonadales bacterium]